jgi:hypothetical protein
MSNRFAASFAAVALLVSAHSFANVPHPVMGMPAPFPTGIIAPHPVGLPVPHPVGIIVPRPVGLPMPPRPIGLPRPIGMPPRPPIVGMPIIPQNYALNCFDFQSAAPQIASLQLRAFHVRHETFNVQGQVNFRDGSVAPLAGEAFGNFRGYRVDLNIPGVGTIDLLRQGDESPYFRGTVSLYGRYDSYALQCQYSRIGFGG